MGKDFFVAIALVWVALPMFWLAVLLKRFKLTRVLGVALHWQSFILYALSCVAISIVTIEMAGRTDWRLSLGFIGSFAAVPLTVCTIHYYRQVSGWLANRRSAARLTNT